MSRIIIVLYNWPIHLAKKVMEYANKFGWRIIYASPYSPELWAIELFFNILKRRSSMQSRSESIKLNGKTGIGWIKGSLNIH